MQSYYWFTKYKSKSVKEITASTEVKNFVIPDKTEKRILNKLEEFEKIRNTSRKRCRSKLWRNSSIPIRSICPRWLTNIKTLILILISTIGVQISGKIKVSIYDMSGKKVDEQLINADEPVLTSALQQGTYILTGDGIGIAFSSKLIINR